MKGQLLSVLSLMAILFIVTGNMFSAVIAQDEIKESITYSANDVNQLLKAEIKSEIYRKNIRKELNYSFNNAAYTLSPEWNELNWDDNIPEKESIKAVLNEEIRTGDYGIINQNRLRGCETPELQPEPIEILNFNSVELSLETSRIECSSRMSTAIVPIQEEYQVENENNNALHLANYARTLAQKVNEVSSDSLEDSGSATTSSCERPDTSETKRTARSNARDNTLSGEENIAEEAYDQTSDSRESFISGDYDTSYTGSFSQVDSNETRCTYDCECEEENETGCECQGTEYSYTYNYTAGQLSTDFELEDSEHEVLTYEGEKQLSFDFQYSKSLQ